MGKLEDALRSEVSRLARKEIRTACEPLRKQVRELMEAVARLKAGVSDPPAESAFDPSLELQADPAEVEKARFSPGLIKKLRQRLNITQAELAALLGGNVTTVAFWEQGRNRPTESSQAKLVALRKLGRRDVKRLLKGQRGR